MNRRQALSVLAAAPLSAAEFRSKWPSGEDCVWIGPEYWANPLQDWRLRNGRIECVVAGGERNVFLLTHELQSAPGKFEMSVRCGPLDSNDRGKEGFVGFRVGIRGRYNDYRDDAIYGIGLNAGITADGLLFIGKLDPDNTVRIQPGAAHDLRLQAEPRGTAYRLTLTANGSSLIRDDIPGEWVTGGAALMCHSGPVAESPDPASIVVTMSGLNRKQSERGGTMRYWFSDWRVAGDKFAVHPDRAWGPILFTMYTLSRGVMKLTAQIAPVNPAGKTVRLEIQSAGGAWRQVGQSAIHPEARNAVFRVASWDDRRDIPYRVSFASQTVEGVVRRDPRDKDRIVVGGLSCVNDLGFPHAEITRGIRHFQPDILLFTGDQIYERVGGFGIQRTPLEPSILDYLRKWYVFGWAFRDFLKDTPAVCMPDDHDVFHGNVWGAGGRHAEGMGQPGQDSGGYTQPAAWVNMVQRTQTSHLPDPFDPMPVEQGIGVYYTSLKYGGIDFAILEDRKWKSAPKVAVPKGRIVNGWAQNPEYNAPVDGDVPGAQLLGGRQIRFLNDWAADWKGGTWMKVAVSQTIFATVATLPPPADTDAVTPKLPVLKPGEYPKGEMVVADHDSNGWPQTPRNTALRAIRRAAAFHIAGDQHIGSTVQYGVDEWNDASWAVCVPAVSNLFPRRWYPPAPGRDADPAFPLNTGEYLDGFGNKVTVHAVFNPSLVEIEPKEVNHRAPGYGIIEFDKPSRKITIANWARWTDPSEPGAKPVPGWPITIEQTANGLPTKWFLDPVDLPAGAYIQIVDEGSKEIVYTLRPREVNHVIAGVPREGTYTIRLIGDDGRVARTLPGRKAKPNA